MITEPHPARCFCKACGRRAWHEAPVLLGFIGRLPGEPKAFTDVSVWCAWCARWHRHGDSASQPGDVLHRAPHCGYPNSPYRPHGYRIAVTRVPLSAVYSRMKCSTDDQMLAIAADRPTAAIEQLRAQVLPAI